MQNVNETTTIRPLDTIEYLAVQIQVYVETCFWQRFAISKGKCLYNKTKCSKKLMLVYCHRKITYELFVMDF